MSDPTPTPRDEYSPERLPGSRVRFSALVRALVDDDIVAEGERGSVWLAAHRTPPRGESSLRGWVRAVVSNLRRQDRRESRRRENRERKSAMTERLPSPAEVLAEEGARSRLLAAVLELAEPHRTLVLLRFWDGLEPTAIGERLGVPASTIRDRLDVALHRLRATLDRQFGGRESWRACFVPYAAKLLAPTTFISIGALLMSAKLVTVAAAIMMLGVAWWLVRSPNPVGGPSNPSATTTTSRDAQHPVVADGSEAAVAGADSSREDAPAIARDLQAHTQPARPKLRIVDRENGEPLPGAQVWFTVDRDGYESLTTREIVAHAAVHDIAWLDDARRIGVETIADAAGFVEVPAFEEWLSIVARTESHFGIGDASVDRSIPAVLELQRVSTLTVVARAADSRQSGALTGLAIGLGSFSAKRGLDPWLSTATDSRGIAVFENVEFELRHHSRDRPVVASTLFPTIEPRSVDIFLDDTVRETVELTVPPFGWAQLQIVDEHDAPIAVPLVAGFGLAPNHEDTELGGGELDLWVDLDRGTVRVPVGVGARVGVAAFFVDDARPPLRFEFDGPAKVNETVLHTVRAGERRGRFVGRVVDESGVPIASTILRVTVDLPGRGWQQVGREYIDGFSFRTDPDGRFALAVPTGLSERLPASLRFTSFGRSGMTAAASGMERVAIRRLEPSSIAGRGDTDLGELVLESEEIVAAGVVIDERGQPVANARIALNFAEDEKGYTVRDIARSDTHGRFEVRRAMPTDLAELSVRAEGFLIAKDVGFTRGSTHLEIRLHRTASVSGRVILPPELDASRVVVGFSGSAPLRWSDLWPIEPKTAPLDREGRFTFDRLDSGSMSVGVYVKSGAFDDAAGPPLVLIDDVKVKNARPVDDPRLESIDLRGRVREIEFEVVDSDGAPIAGAELDVIATELLQQRLRSTTDSKGRARLLLSTAAVSVRVERDGFVARDVELGPDDGSRVARIVMDRGAR